MSILIVALCIALLILLVSQFKINAFLSFLIVSILAGLLLGLDVSKITTSVQKGMGDMLGSLAIIIVAGAMLGKLVAESGAAQKIASSLMKIFGEKYVSWALVITGFIIGIPLYYNVGFVLVVPLIFTVAYQYKLPLVYIGLPMMAALSVTHGFLPPHPSPTALVEQFHADMGTTLFYGIIVAIPTVIIAGPLFALTLKNINPPLPKTFVAAPLPEDQLPSLTNSVLSALTPVLLLAITTLLAPHIAGANTKKVMSFISDPAIVMLVSLIIATYTIGVRQNISIKRIMDIYSDAVKDIAMLLLIIGGAGALKQILTDSGVSNDIAALLSGMDVHPLILGWAISCVLRLCVGSATVAGLTAAGIVAPLIDKLGVDPNLMALSVGAGSLMFSHVNDSGFWLFKEYFNLTIKQTMRSWSLMETIVAFAGLIGVLIIDFVK
jgi:Gnt-I system high-affinity gluconate transporter